MAKRGDSELGKSISNIVKFAKKHPLFLWLRQILEVQNRNINDFCKTQEFYARRNGFFPLSTFHFSNCYCGVVPCKTNLTQPVPFTNLRRKPQILCDVPWRRVTCGTFGVLSFRKPWGLQREKSIAMIFVKSVDNFSIIGNFGGFQLLGPRVAPNIINPTKKHLIYLVGIL